MDNNKKIKITYNGNVIEVQEGITLYEISKMFQKDYEYDILAAKVDNDIYDLNTELNKSCNIEFYDRTSPVGSSVYLASTVFVLFLAVREVLGPKVRIIAKHSANWGICFKLLDTEINKDLVSKLEEEMHNIQKQDYSFMKLSVSRSDAIKFFRKNKQEDKANSLKYISNTYVNLYRINDLYDYFYAKLAYSTKSIDTFKLTYIDSSDIVLTTPDIFNNNELTDYRHYSKVYDEFNRFDKFCNDCYGVDVVYAANLNKAVSMSKTKELINLSEAYYDDELARAGYDICTRKGKCRVVFLAGPSSSGKTTTANKLKNYIKVHGINVYNISLDDYFYSKEDYTGDYDIIDALDVDYRTETYNVMLGGAE